jgi:hypothetical protein
MNWTNLVSPIHETLVLMNTILHIATLLTYHCLHSLMVLYQYYHIIDGIIIRNSLYKKLSYLEN